jgi:GNAT superfamily N-acetyltransferase
VDPDVEIRPTTPAELARVGDDARLPGPLAPGTVLVAWAGDRPVGQVVVRDGLTDPDPPAPPVPVADDLHVAPPARRRGVADALLDAAESSRPGAGWPTPCAGPTPVTSG